jgi:hypothetical protein
MFFSLGAAGAMQPAGSKKINLAKPLTGLNPMGVPFQTNPVRGAQSAGTKAVPATDYLFNLAACAQNPTRGHQS